MKWKYNFRAHTHTHAESTIWKCFRSLRLKLLLLLMELYCCYCCIRHALHIRTHIHTCHLLFALFSNLCTKTYISLLLTSTLCYITEKKTIFVSSLSPLLHVHHDFAETGFCIVTIFPKTKKNVLPKKGKQTTRSDEFCLLWLCSSIKYTITHYAYAKRERDVLCA